MLTSKLTDREQVYDLKIRYGRAVDTCDLELMRSCFTDDATFQYDPINGQGALMQSWDEFMVFWKRMQDPMRCLHQFTNFTFDFRGDDCGYSCLLFAQHWPRAADFSGDVACYTTGGRYDSRARRTESGWRIYQHHAQMLWGAGDANALWGGVG